MAKFVFVFVLALIALQGSDAHLHREDVTGNNVQDLVTELKKLIQESASRFAGVYTELKDKIVEIEDEANIPSLVADFQKQVEQLWTHDGAAARETVAQQQIFEVQRLAAVLSCKFEINEDMTDLRKQLEVLTTKVGDLLKEIGRDVYNCLRESQGSNDKFTQCMDDNIFNAKQKLQVVENEIDETFNVIEKSIPVFTDKFSTCVTDHKEKLVAKIQVSEDTIKKCVDGNNAALFTLQGSDAHLLREDAAGNNVQDLVNELKKLIQESASRFADIYTELKDKIVEIENEANVSGLFEDFKQKVEQLWTHEGAAACESVAKEQITEVVQLAIEISCKLEINEEVFELKKQLEVLGSKVEALLKEIGRDVYNCLRESNGNHEKFTQCMDEKVSNAEQKLQVVKTEIDETFNVIEKTIPVFTEKFSTCAADHKDKLVAKMEVVFDALKKCVDGNNAAPVSFKKSGFVKVADYVKYLADEFNHSTAHVTTNLPDSLAEKINELVSAVDQILSEHKTDEKLCGPAAHRQLDSLTQDSKVEAEVCESRVLEVADALEVKMSILADKATALDELSSEMILACTQEHLGNEEEIDRCVEGVTEELSDQMEQLQQEVDKTMQDGVLAIYAALKEFDVCVGKVEDKIVTQGKIVLDTLNSCFNHADLLF